jgi:hypothetical protein
MVEGNEMNNVLVEAKKGANSGQNVPGKDIERFMELHQR